MFTTKTIEVKNTQEIETMRQAGAIVASILGLLSGMVRPQMTTGEIDAIARAELARRGAKPAFLDYRGFPAAICVSVNAEVVHGIPSHKRILRDGDIVSLDFGCIVDGWYSDAAVTVGIGATSNQANALISATRKALELGINAMQSGSRIGDISYAVQKYVEGNNFSIVKDFVGHGIGRQLHEEPPVPNYGRPGTGPRLAPGMVLAIEPMVNAGGADVETLSDGWTTITRDGSLSAHFEHTVALTENGPEVLTLPA